MPNRPKQVVRTPTDTQREVAESMVSVVDSNGYDYGWRVKYPGSPNSLHLSKGKAEWKAKNVVTDIAQALADAGVERRSDVVEAVEVVRDALISGPLGESAEDQRRRVTIRLGVNDAIAAIRALGV